MRTDWLRQGTPTGNIHPHIHHHIQSVSGSHHLACSIRLTPLNSGKSLANHRMSAFASSLTLITPCLLVARSKLHNLGTKARTCLTHLHTKWSFLVAGAHALLADSAKPSFANKYPRNSKGPLSRYLCLRTRQVIKVIEDLDPILLTNICNDVGCPLASNARLA